MIVSAKTNPLLAYEFPEYFQAYPQIKVLWAQVSPEHPQAEHLAQAGLGSSF